MASSMFDNASIYITPSGYKTSFLYPTKPLGTANFSCVRNTTATRVNKDGLIESVSNNVPRLDYSQESAFPALLVEPAATNLLLRSEEFDNAYWTKTNTTVTANATTAPDGTLTADKVAATTTGTDRRIQRADGLASGMYTTSIFAKAAELSTIRMYAVDFNAQATFNLSAGTVNNILGGATASIESYRDGWYKCSITITYAGGATQALYLNIGNALGGDPVTAGDGVFIWGAQLETGSVATSYIPTVASTVTRNADVISLTGASGLIGQTEGVLFAEINFNGNQKDGARIVVIDGGAEISSTYLRINTSNQVEAVSFNSGLQYFATSLPLILGTNKVALAYSIGNYAFFLNGNLVNEQNSGIPPACSNIRIGSSDLTAVSGHFLNDRIYASAIYPSRLDNAVLQAITTL